MSGRYDDDVSLLRWLEAATRVDASCSSSSSKLCTFSFFFVRKPSSAGGSSSASAAPPLFSSCGRIDAISSSNRSKRLVFEPKTMKARRTEAELLLDGANSTAFAVLNLGQVDLSQHILGVRLDAEGQVAEMDELLNAPTNNNLDIPVRARNKKMT